MGAKSVFNRTVRADFKMGLGIPFLLAVVGVVLGFIFDNFESLRNDFGNPLIYGEGSVSCIMYYFFNSFSFGGVFTEYFAAIMAAIPFSTNYCQEVKGGMGGQQAKTVYDRERNSFVVDDHELGMAYEYEGKPYQIDGEIKILYPIGSGEWCWDYAEGQDMARDAEENPAMEEENGPELGM